VGEKCIYEDICKISFKDLINDNITSFGVVFNLSKYGTRGSHWVSIYGSICNKNKTLNIFYYDSGASKSFGDIRKFIV
jgi:hypothetical protein